jgi:hypothetical protein
MDCLRLQTYLVRTTDATGQTPIKHPTIEITKKLDSLLCHLDWTLCLQPQAERRQSRDALFARNSILDASDLSFLPLVYPHQYSAYFKLAMAHGVSSSAGSALSLVSLHSHFDPMFQSHPLCPEEAEKMSRSAPLSAKLYLCLVFKSFFQHFRDWVDYHWEMSKSTMANDDAAVKVALKMMTKKGKQQQQEKKTDGGKDSKAGEAKMTHLIEQSRRHSAARSALNLNVEATHAFIFAVCGSLGEHDEVVEVCASCIRPRELFLEASERDFKSYVSSLLQFDTIPLDELVPSLVSARIDDYVCSLLSLRSILPLNHLTAHCSRLLAGALHMMRGGGGGEGEADKAKAKKVAPADEKRRGGTSAVRQYLNGLYAKVIKPIVERNLLVFSETFDSFVLPHCVDAAKKDDEITQILVTLDRFLSETELCALAALVGPVGVSYLVEDLLYADGVLPTMGKLKTACEHPEAVNVAEVLGHGVRLGCYLAIRNLILGGLDTTSRAKMPFVHSLAKNDVLGSRISASIGLKHHRDDYLVEAISEIGLFERTDLYRLINIMSTVIPHSSRIISTQYMSTAKMSTGGSSVCIDGHFNNLNCLAIGLAHVLSSLHRATAARGGEDEDGEEEDEDANEDKCAQALLSLLTRRTLDLERRSRLGAGGATADNKKNQLHTMDSTTLLLRKDWVRRRQKLNNLVQGLARGFVGKRRLATTGIVINELCKIFAFAAIHLSSIVLVLRQIWMSSKCNQLHDALFSQAIRS